MERACALLTLAQIALAVIYIGTIDLCVFVLTHYMMMLSTRPRTPVKSRLREWLHRLSTSILYFSRG